MTGEFPGMPKIMAPVVDVREVAFAHLQAIKVPEASGHRFALIAESLWFRDYARILKEAYPEYKFRSDKMGFWLVKIISWFDTVGKQMVAMWEQPLYFDNSKS